jgi:hypothetical protein
VLGSYPLLILLDDKGGQREEMKEAIARLEAAGIEPTLANWLADTRRRVSRVVRQGRVQSVSCACTENVPESFAGAGLRYAVRMFSLSRRWLTDPRFGVLLGSLVGPSGAARPSRRCRVATRPEPMSRRRANCRADAVEAVRPARRAVTRGRWRRGGGDPRSGPGEAEVAGPPEDYGQLKPPVPAPAAEALKVHGMAGYEVVAVYSQPNLESRTARLHAHRYADDGEREGRGGGLQELGFYALPAGGSRARARGWWSTGSARCRRSIRRRRRASIIRCRTTTGSCAGGTARCGGACRRTRS